MMIYYNINDAEKTPWISSRVRTTSELHGVQNLKDPRPLPSLTSSHSTTPSSLCSSLPCSPHALFTPHTLSSESLYPCCFFGLEWCLPDLFSPHNNFLSISEGVISSERPFTTIQSKITPFRASQSS